MKYRFDHRGQIYEVSIERSGSDYMAAVDGRPVEFEILDNQAGQLSLRVDGKPSILHTASDQSGKWISVNGCTYHLKKPAFRRSSHTTETGGDLIRAPMPAQVMAVQAQAGDLVEKGQVLILLEAMKMEIRIKAPVSGKLNRLAVKSGQTVERDQLLAEIQIG